MIHMDTRRVHDDCLADVISVALAALHISQRSAALVTGIPQATLSRRLAGQQPFLITELDAIAKLLGVKVSELLARAEAICLVDR